MGSVKSSRVLLERKLRFEIHCREHSVSQFVCRGMTRTCRTFSTDEQAEVILVKKVFVQAPLGLLVRDHVLHEL